MTGDRMDYRIDYDQIIHTFSVKTIGRMCADDFINMAEDILVHPMWTAHGNVIFDHTELDFEDVPVNDLDRIRGFHANREGYIGKGKSAIVVGPGRKEKWHELWSKGDKLDTDNRVKVFEDMTEAQSWLH